MDPDVALAFLDFVVARHEAYEARQRGESQPWTADPIVASQKFTNVFRVLDYGSQFVFDLANDDPAAQDLLMRLFLYRHTGRVEVWKHLYNDLAGWPTVADLDDVLASWREYRGEFKVITSGNSTKGKPSRKGRISDRPVFTGAYLVFPQSAVPGTDKLDSIVGLTKRLFDGHSMPNLVSNWMTAESQEDRFYALRRNKGVADFMSMQILTDWGYVWPGPRDLEDEFVVAGPGALKGAKAIAPTWSAARVIEWAWETLQTMPGCPELAVDGFVRRVPSHMDVQNCLCEFSKYIRYAAKPLPSKQYTPNHPGPQPSPVLPTHW